MKRILTLVMSLLLVLTLIPVSAVSVMAVEDDGETTSTTSGVTYVDVANYDAFMAQITDGKISKSIRLTGDIVFPENTVITSEIATLADGVVIDGNGHSMTGFTMSASSADMALFSVASGAKATVISLNIGSDVEGGEIIFELTPASDGMSFGVIAATVAEGASLSLISVDVYANITWKSGKSADVNCAGFVGAVYGDVSFSNCSLNGAVKYKSGVGSYPNVAGFVGLAGEKSTLVFNACENNANIDAQQRASGFISKMSAISLEIINCKNNGNVSGCYFAAGFVSEMTPTSNSTTYTIRNCINNGNVSCERYLAGGFVASAILHSKALAYLVIENSVNTGNVSAKTARTTVLSELRTDKKYTGVGGFIGCTTANKTDAVKIMSCVNIGDITNTADMVGGIIGSMFIQAAPAVNIENTINSGKISGGGYAGGFVGGLFRWNKLKITNGLSIGDVTSKGGFAGPFLGGHQDLKDIGTESEPSLSDHCIVSVCRYFCEVTSLNADGVNDETKVHIGKSGQISKHGKAGDSLYFAGNVCKVGKFTYDAEAGFTFTVYPEAPSFVGIQLSNTYPNKYGDNVINVRFVAVLDNADLSAYNSIGFKLTAIAADGTESKVNEITGKSVYRSITASTDSSIKAYTAEELGGEYVIALSIEGVPAIGTVSFNVTAYAVANDGTTELCDFNTYNIQFTEGVCTSVSLVLD